MTFCQDVAGDTVQLGESALEGEGRGRGIAPCHCKTTAAVTTEVPARDHMSYAIGKAKSYERLKHIKNGGESDYPMPENQQEP